MPTIREMISFHNLERQIYGRLVSLGNPITTSRSILALWMYLQFIGVDLLTYIRDCREDSVIEHFISEAGSILQIVRAGVRPMRERLGIPYTGSMAVEQLNLRFFYFNKDAIARGMDYILDGIGTIIFNPDMNDSGGLYYNRVAPNAVDCKTLLIAFHDSVPRKEDILEFFGRRWGHCIEDVTIEQTPRGVKPVYGRIVITSEALVEAIFNNRPVLSMEINGSTTTVRKFAPN
ncbi:uncharacterized protein A4U43_C08F31970 [Asparagus officinalis]|uniref:uncharacterized protein LOC109819695 n=1 Tax=Asparagus officinalis TaxID=4686 RepID=UPI00098E424D|nr:uncharacterized protein LOC109819695 [Asparagus officinalis]ONK61632.1 uncharacterized protein A4U43_C08F31970 [Asparagus officinalis]